MSHPPSPETHKWYFAYGSNIDPERIGCYIRGGQPQGARRTYKGCRDTSDPVAVMPWTEYSKVRFAGSSTVWGGGIAFLDQTADSKSARAAHGVKYLLKKEQLDDIYAQENNLPVGSVQLDLSLFDKVPHRNEGLDYNRTRFTQSYTTGLGKYDEILCLTTYPDYGISDMVTFTASNIPESNAPSESYLDKLANGLSLVHGMSGAAITAYFNTLPGLATR